ncbi:MAG: ATP-dependent DNA helicase RecG [Bacillota bacterium]
MRPLPPTQGRSKLQPYMGDPLNQPVQYLRGIGPEKAKDLAKQGIATVRDLIERVPRTYRDYSNFKAIIQAQNGQIEALRGTVIQALEQKLRGRLSLTKVIISDGSGTAAGVWFNQPWQAKRFPIGTKVLFAGVVERRGAQIQITNPEWEIIDDEGADPIHAGRIVPIYPLTGALNPRDVRRAVKQAVEMAAHLMPATLPEPVRLRQGLLPMAEAWREIHFPASEEEKARARTTLAFEELLVLQVGLALIRQQTVEEQVGIAHGPDGEITRRFYDSLPFRLTEAQERVIRQVKQDMEGTKPMNRLVQGDVGSGKTMVAAAALAKAVDSGHQGVLMAPTEILAEQHYLNLRRIFAPLGVEVVLVTGSLTKKEREANLGLLQMGLAQIAVGTHALIEDRVNFKDLSLVITDEQHRFGVRQRARLQQKGEVMPDVLVMTATPIPRTLALTLYGDLDVSIIDQLPPGRKPVGTYWRPEADRRKVYDHLVKTEVAAGRQGYVICPLVEESDKLQAQAATEWRDRLADQYPQVRFGLLHGRLRPAEKEAVMEQFRRGEIQVLVATTVVEVGVDVPNASMIIIEGADRFGLSQLHQLRGRVGRGPHQSYCVLISDAKNEEARERMQVMQKYADGFSLSEKDLELRGPGEFFGTRQHGMPDLKVANPIADLPILEKARAEALELVRQDPQLRRAEHQALRQAIRARLGEAFGFILVS